MHYMISIQPWFFRKKQKFPHNYLCMLLQSLSQIPCQRIKLRFVPPSLVRRNVMTLNNNKRKSPPQIDCFAAYVYTTMHNAAAGLVEGSLLACTKAGFFLGESYVSKVYHGDSQKPTHVQDELMGCSFKMMLGRESWSSWLLLMCQLKVCYHVSVRKLCLKNHVGKEIIENTHFSKVVVVCAACYWWWRSLSPEAPSW